MNTFSKYQLVVEWIKNIFTIRERERAEDDEYKVNNKITEL
jgi:hypothetical protein